MNNTTSIPYDWVKKIEPAILQNDQVPLLGNPPPFPWAQFSRQFAKSISLDHLEITPGTLKWRGGDELLEGLASPLVTLSIKIPPLEGSAFWLLSEADIKTLMSNLLYKEPKPAGIAAQPLSDKDFIAGFYRFLAQEAISQLFRIDFDKSLSFQLQSDSEIANAPSLCQDISIKINDQILWGRVVLSSELTNAWREKYANRTVNSIVNQSLIDNSTLPLSLEAGKVTLDYSEIASLSPGDFIKLDHCTMDPEDNKGLVNITLDGKTLFRARFKGHELKILELPLYEEAPTAMEKNTPEDDWKNDENDTEADFDDNDDDFSFDDDFTEDHETMEEEQTYENAQETNLEDIDHPSEEHAPVDHQQEEKKPFSPNEIPVQLIVEMGKINIPIQKLMELQPGNILELNIKPEDGVNLVINGKCIGKGELLKIGDLLGVRVLDLG